MVHRKRFKWSVVQELDVKPLKHDEKSGGGICDERSTSYFMYLANKRQVLGS